MKAERMWLVKNPYGDIIAGAETEEAAWATAEKVSVSYRHILIEMSCTCECVWISEDKPVTAELLERFVNEDNSVYSGDMPEELWTRLCGYVTAHDKNAVEEMFRDSVLVAKEMIIDRLRAVLGCERYSG